jgi:enoyl-CoA hydratase
VLFRSVALITLNRPEALNALSKDLITDLNDALNIIEHDENLSVIVITGSSKAFAAGADIKEMISKSFIDLVNNDFIKPWEQISFCNKPTIAAVDGYALGGGCELAMMCDLLIANENTKFGQPEINLGVFPAAGGTQRLPKAIGKAKAMDMILTGRMMDAIEAEKLGLVSRILPSEGFIEKVLEVIFCE